MRACGVVRCAQRGAGSSAAAECACGGGVMRGGARARARGGARARADNPSTIPEPYHYICSSAACVRDSAQQQQRRA